MKKHQMLLALVYRDQQLSYLELNQKANQLAHYLQKQGVGPEVPVGICLDRSLDMVIGLLGILKSGGAYLPLDPDYPSARLAFMIEDAAPPFLLTQARPAQKLPPSNVKVIYLDTLWDTFTDDSIQNLTTTVTPHNLAYIIYTSGSTGKPKGVMIEHRALVNFTEVAGAEYAIEVGDRVLQFASISFDASAEEIYPCLTRGGTLVLRTDEMLGTVETFLQNCQEMSLSVLDLPTSYWHQLVGELRNSQVKFPEALRLVIIGGEKARPEPLTEWFEHAPPSIRLINTYGPTEATVVATKYDLSPGTDLQRVPIGRPLANVEAYILDKYLQPVPIGVTGELHLGGRGLARGYFNRPKLTAEKFIQDPFRKGANARLYKTGDLARYLSDGNIEFLGRVDNQVKIRGFRIELGEIENALGQHPAVKDVVVLAREDLPGDRKLVAYITLKQVASPATSEWRYFLNKTLPNYMVPSVFIILAEIPLDSNGKVDQKALPPPADRSVLENEFVAPETPMEETLANIWAKVLNLKTVGTYDNFFDVGGDSILSIQIASQANQAGLLLTPTQLFEHPTIAQLAANAGVRRKINSEQGLITGAVSLTPGQHWFFEQNFSEPHHWNQAFFLEVNQTLDTSFLAQAVQQLLIQHDALRLRFIADESGWRQEMVSPDEGAPVITIDLSNLSDLEQSSTIQSMTSDLQAGLSLSNGPLIKVALFDFGPRKPNRLLIIIHQLVIDSRSWPILLEQLEYLYQQVSQHKPPQLPPKTTSLKYWAARLTAYAHADNLRQELPFWLATQKKQHARLPVDYPQNKNNNVEESARTVTVSLESESTRILLKDVPKAYQTQTPDILLTALTQALTPWTMTASLPVDLETSGREMIFEEVDLLYTVGPLAATFPVILSLEEASTPGEMLKAVKEQLRCIPNNGFGYSLLRYLSNDAEIAKTLRALHRPELSFKYLGQIDEILSDSSMFTRNLEQCGSTRSPCGNRPYLLEIEAAVINNELQVHWIYSQNIHQKSTIERLAREFMNSLKNLIAHCRLPQAGGYTPSDFPEADLSQQELDDLFAEISELQ